ncbi:MAG: hypothetical protein WBP22_01930 [Candidatus Saccharimonas sp.]
MSKFVVVNGIRRSLSYAAAFLWTHGTLQEALCDSVFPYCVDDEGDWSNLEITIFDNELPDTPSQADSVFDEMRRLREEIDATRARFREVGTAEDSVMHEAGRLEASLGHMQLRYTQLAVKLTEGK